MISAVLAAALAASSAFSVDNVFSEHMVLQRGKPLRFSGSGQPGLMVIVNFAGKATNAVASADGRWQVEFPAMEAGGPHLLSVACRAGSNAAQTQEFDDILIGDVWYCSGQSNMEMPMWGDNQYYRYPDGDSCTAAATDPNLRFLFVPRTLAVDGPAYDISSRKGWFAATDGKSAQRISAVGYWYGRLLRQALDEKVPVGIISCAWGGSRIEPWIPKAAFERAGDSRALEVLKSAEASRAQLDESKVKELKRTMLERLQAWVAKFEASAPEVTARAKAEWAKRDIDLTGWSKSRIPMSYSEPGVVWFRYETEIPQDWVGHEVVCWMDFVNDCDETYFNGEKIGETSVDTSMYWSAPRSYLVRDVQPGRAVIAIRAKSHRGPGVLGRNYRLVDLTSGAQIDFSKDGFWERLEFRPDTDRIGARPDEPWTTSVAGVRNSYATPSTLYNAMTAPLTAMNIRGVLWYQGCSNANETERYGNYQQMLVDALRVAWRDANLPFLVTQLSAFDRHQPQDRMPDDFWKLQTVPSQAMGYGKFRLVQEKAALAQPNVGIACTIDIGDHSDIHPKDKREVARRLLSEAQRISYGKAEFRPGPRAVSARRDGAAVVVSFGETGRGLALDGGRAFHPHLFALAGEDGAFHWADGEWCEDGTVRVTSADVPEPRKVQYCISGYPPGVTFRRVDDGLPVFPFELDVN